MRSEETTYIASDVELDGNEYVKCVFKQCRLVYRAQGNITLDECTFVDCNLVFEGAAARTLAFLKDMYAGGWRTVIDATIDNIRGVPPLNTRKGRIH